MSNVLTVTDATFAQEIEQHDGLAVVDFWATWCGPCRTVAPIVEQLATEYAGRARVVVPGSLRRAVTVIRGTGRRAGSVLGLRRRDVLLDPTLVSQRAIELCTVQGAGSRCGGSRLTAGAASTGRPGRT